MIDLTVVITTFNRQALVPKAIESVKNADKDAEIIVVDDASTDQTESVCKGISGIKYIRMSRNSGTAAARNAGILASNNPYIAFLDDDDKRLPHSFNSQLVILKNHSDCALVHGRPLYADQNDKLISGYSSDQPFPQGDVLINLFRKNFITLSSVIVKKECIQNAGLFDTSREMLGLEDWDMWLRMALSYSILAVEEPVVIYRKPAFRSGQWYSDPGKQFSMAWDAYRNKWFHLPGLKEKVGDRFKPIKKEILIEISDIIAFGALNHSSSFRDKGRRLVKLVECRPRNLLNIKFYKTVARALVNAR